MVLSTAEKALGYFVGRSDPFVPRHHNRACTTKPGGMEKMQGDFINNIFRVDIACRHAHRSVLPAHCHTLSPCYPVDLCFRCGRILGRMAKRHLEVEGLLVVDKAWNQARDA